MQPYLFGSVGTLQLEGGLEPSEWRVNDAVAYEVLRETAGLLTALLLARSRSNPGDHEARRELENHRRELLAVDGFDRKAVDRLTIRLSVRIQALRGTP